MFTSEQLNSLLCALPEPVFVLTRSGRYAGFFGGKDTRYYHAGQQLLGQTLHMVFRSMAKTPCCGASAIPRRAAS